MGLTGGSSKQSSQFRRLATELPALLRHRVKRAKRKKPRQAQRRLMAEQVAQLVAEYKAGDDMSVLAARWSLHRTFVAAQLRRAGVTLRRQGIPDDRLDEAVRPYGEGWSCQRLAEHFSCDDETVRQALKRAGVQLRAPWGAGRTATAVETDFRGHGSGRLHCGMEAFEELPRLAPQPLYGFKQQCFTQRPDTTAVGNKHGETA